MIEFIEPNNIVSITQDSFNLHFLSENGIFSYDLITEEFFFNVNLSSNINEKRCSMVFFRIFAENISTYTAEKLNSPKSRTFNDVLRYMSGSQSTVKFPHDTWADVVTNNTDQQSIFLQEIEDLTGRTPAHGTFAADMQVALINDGPVTILVDSQESIKEPSSKIDS